MKKLKTAFFIDGQNLFRSAKACFGYHYPNIDIRKMLDELCATRAFEFHSATFYTGVPTKEDHAQWNYFWGKKLLVIKNSGVATVTKSVRYRVKKTRCPKGHEFDARVGAEKGVDVRLALDVVRAARNPEIDAIVIFSQDQDLVDAVKDAKEEAKQLGRSIAVFSAFPFSKGPETNQRGINNSLWIKIEKPQYDLWIDPVDYRMPPTRPTTMSINRLAAKFSKLTGK